jgi:hypothetical protein
VTTAPPAPLPPLARDPWAVLTLLAVLPLVFAMRGAPWGEPVAEDFDFLHRALVQGMGTLLDGGGSHAFWRPIPHQLYYAALGPTILASPALGTVLHLVLLALGAVLLYRVLRSAMSGPVACAAAAFTLMAESTRTIAAWPTQFVDVGLFLFSMLAVHAASRRRTPLAAVALLAALLCKEIAIVTGLLLPFVPLADPRDARATRQRLAVTSFGTMLAWGLASLAVRQHAGLTLPQRIAASTEAVQASWLERLGWATHGSLKALASLPFVPSADDAPTLLVAGLLALGALAMFVVVPAARARLVERRGVLVWAAAWWLLATATLTPIFPSWQPNRSQYGSVGAGVLAIGALEAAHPALAVAFTGARLVALLRAPGAAASVTVEPPESGAFMDWAHLTRLQRFMRAARTRLLQAWPRLPVGGVVVQENLPHGVEYAFGGDHALQVWYRDPSLRWKRFDAFRDEPESTATVILQGSPGHEPPLALVAPSAVRDLFAAIALVPQNRPADMLVLLERADAAQRDSAAVQYWVTSRAMRGYALVQLDRAAEAVPLVSEVLPQDPTDRAARQVLVEALLHLARYDEAAAHLDTLQALAPDDPATVQLRETLARLRPAAGASPPAR